MAVYDAMADIQ